MRKLIFALGVTAAMLLAGGLAWKADAMTWSSATSNLPAATKNFSPVERTPATGRDAGARPATSGGAAPWRAVACPVEPGIASVLRAANG